MYASFNHLQIKRKAEEAPLKPQKRQNELIVHPANDDDASTTLPPTKGASKTPGKQLKVVIVDYRTPVNRMFTVNLWQTVSLHFWAQLTTHLA
jgi:hypothetical protein